MDKLKKSGKIKFEVWVNFGVGYLKKGTEERITNEERKHAIIREIHSLINDIR